MNCAEIKKMEAKKIYLGARNYGGKSTIKLIGSLKLYIRLNEEEPVKTEKIEICRISLL